LRHQSSTCGLRQTTPAVGSSQVKSLEIGGSTTATADEALTGRFWNGAIQNYWNEIAQTASLAMI
jgi:hypothetical protein